MAKDQPFPMPEPQRSQTVEIICEVARSHDFPPVYLTTNIEGEPEVDAARREAMRRVMTEVPGMTKSMLARAWDRDPRRIRELMNKPSQPRSSARSSDLQDKSTPKRQS